MLYFKACPKCVTGTVEHNSDSHGEFTQCLNCGFMRDTPDGVSVPAVKKLLAGWRDDAQTLEQTATGAVA